MSTSLHKLVGRLQRSRRGGTLVLVTVFVVALFGFAALSIDMARVFQEQRHINVGTDAAALAGVSLLTNRPPHDSTLVNQVVAEATAIADTNGVKAAEIAAGARNGFPGAVQVGRWTNGVFQANQTTSSGRYTAVRVPARRTVDLYFAKVIGLGFMNPAVSSVAALEPAGRAANVVPFGVTIGEVTKHVFGETLTLNTADIGSGKQGKLDLAGYQNTGAWQNDMLSPDGCNCTVSVGPVPTISGNAQVPQSFNAIPPGTELIMPVVSDTSFSGNSAVANVVGFVLVKLLGSSGTGANWHATVKFLDRVVGEAGGGSCPEPCVSVRALVQ
jgi:Flp pilus assembly protein TadG